MTEKFRAWDGKEMHYTSSKNVEFTLARHGWSFEDIHSEDGVELCNDENGTLMKYTGLKDKNVKEIYERDIVNWRGEDFNMTIIFHEGTFLAIASSSVYEPGKRLFYPLSQYGSPKWSEFVILGNKLEGINRTLIESNVL